MILVLISFVSATACVECENPKELTIVNGTVYTGSIDNPVAGATISAVCHHNGTDYTKNGHAPSDADGKYIVFFLPEKCTYGDYVTVNAEQGSLTGTSEGQITLNDVQQWCAKLDVGLVNVPLIPEFGFYVGALTLISAIGIFFIVRRN